MNHHDPFYNHPQPHPNQNPYPNYPQQGVPGQQVPPQNMPYAPPQNPYGPSQNPYGPPKRILPTQRARLDPPPRKKRGFFASILPWRGDSFGEVLRKFIFLIAFAAFCFCAYLLFVDYAMPLINNNREMEEQREIYYPEFEDDADTDGLGVNVRQPKFDKLYNQNPDIKGWIKINNTNVDYPVYQSSTDDPEYYLKRKVNGEYSAHGTIFMDARVDLDGDYRNIILYGHHMADGSMFANITKFKNLDYYKKRPTLTFDSIYEDAEWKIFSIFITNTKPEHGEVFYFIRTKFQDDNDYMGFVNQLRVRSVLDIPVDVKADDKIIMLSTCSYEFSEARTVLCARRVRPGESGAVDVSLAKTAANPLYPDIWYRKFGGTKPNVPEYQPDGIYQSEIDLDPFANESSAG